MARGKLDPSQQATILTEKAQLPGSPALKGLWWKDLQWSPNQEADDSLTVRARPGTRR